MLMEATEGQIDVLRGRRFRPIFSCQHYIFALQTTGTCTGSRKKLISLIGIDLCDSGNLLLGARIM